MTKTLDEIVSDKDISTEKSGLAKLLNNPDRGIIGKIFDYGTAITATALSYSVIGPLSIIAVGTSALGDHISNWRSGKKTTSAQIRDSAILSSFWSIPVSYAFNLMNAFISTASLTGKVVRAFAQLVALPFAIGRLGFASDYVIRHKKFKGAYKNQVDKFWFKNYKDALTYLSIPNMAVAYLAPAQYHYPASLLTGLIGRTTIGTRHIKALDPYGNGYTNSFYSKHSPSQYSKSNAH